MPMIESAKKEMEALTAMEDERLKKATITIDKGVAEHYASLIPVTVKRDDDGHWYVIPVQMADEFTRLLEQSGEHNLGCYEAEQEFIEKFNQYSTGGDLNNTQLYACTHHKDNPFITKQNPEFLKTDQQELYNLYATGKWEQKKSALEMVEEFHEAFDCPVLKFPEFPTDLRRELRQRIMTEELNELVSAMCEHNMAGILDGLCDLLYTVYGTAHEYGLGPVLDQALAEVHRSNMSKLNGDGTPIIRNDGKVLKGPNYTRPDLEGILNKAGRR